MTGNRFNFDAQKKSISPFWGSNSNNSSSSPSSSTDEKAESKDEMEDIIAGLSKVSVSDTVRAVLTDTNSNFDDLCKQLNSAQISDFRVNTLKEADLVAGRVEKDLNHINRLHGQAKSNAEEVWRLGVVQVVQAYIRCLELDVQKWKSKLQQAGKSESDIAAVKVTVRDFVKWEQRPTPASSSSQQNLQAPAESSTVFDKITFVQFALNYWRSCYKNIRDYEKLVGAEEYAIEKELWRLEQATMSYRYASDFSQVDDINRCRLREPSNINTQTGQPLSVADIQSLIQEHQEKSGYKKNFS